MLPESSRVQFPEKIITKSFASSTNDSTSGSLERGDLSHLSLLRILLQFDSYESEL